MKSLDSRFSHLLPLTSSLINGSDVDVALIKDSWLLLITYLHMEVWAAMAGVQLKGRTKG